MRKSLFEPQIQRLLILTILPKPQTSYYVPKAKERWRIKTRFSFLIPKYSEVVTSRKILYTKEILMKFFF